MESSLGAHGIESFCWDRHSTLQTYMIANKQLLKGCINNIFYLKFSHYILI